MPDQMMDAMADEDTMQGEPQEQSQDSDNSVSVFIPKAALPEGKKYAKGDKITLEVMDTDPETGELETCVADNYSGEKQSPTSWSEGFDKAVPE